MKKRMCLRIALAALLAAVLLLPGCAKNANLVEAPVSDTLPPEVENPAETDDTETPAEDETDGENSLFGLLAYRAPDDALALVVLNPGEEVLQEAKNLRTWQSDETGSKASCLFVPRYRDTMMTLDQLREADGRLEPAGQVLYAASAGDASGVLVKAVLPDAVPTLCLSLAHGGQTASFYITGETMTKPGPVLYVLPGVTGGGIPSADDKPETAPEDMYSYAEAMTVFELTPAKLTAQCGAPDERSETENYGGSISLALRYGGNVFEFECVGGDRENGALYHAVIADDQFAAPRGVKIGDSLDTLLALYPRTESAPVDAGDGTATEVLYGTYMHRASYGLLNSRGGEPASVVFADENTQLRYALENGRILQAEYTLSLG